MLASQREDDLEREIMKGEGVGKGLVFGVMGNGIFMWQSSSEGAIKLV